MSELTIIDPPSEPSGRLKARAATAGRCALVLMLALAVRLAAELRSGSEFDPAEARAVSADIVSDLIPEIASVGTLTDVGVQPALNENGNSIGFVCRTSPQSDRIIGFRGSSDVLLFLDDDYRVTSAALISSEDTPEHVEAVLRDEFFFEQFRGWKLGDPSTFSDTDAVTGATLTAFAMAEGIRTRLKGIAADDEAKTSLKFPDRLSDVDVTSMFGDEEKLTLHDASGFEAEVRDPSGSPVGRIIRTGPLNDSVIGYQGPNEILATTDADGTVTGLRLRRTFDNEPYTDYLKDEDYFWSAFRGKSFADLRKLDLEAEQVEGVSGATMTSMAVAETIVAAAEQYHRHQLSSSQQAERQRIHWTNSDTGTIVVLIAAVIIAVTRLRGIRPLQTAWLLILIGYFGLVTGNLISLAVLSGWSANGPAWRAAPGLLAVVVVSLLLPPSTKRNVYCTHICPHGAAQQLTRRMFRRRGHLRPADRKRLRYLPGLILLTAFGISLVGADVNLAAWEPFNAWIWYVAGISSIIVAVVSLAISFVLPMAYCRYGCAVGRLLEYIRHSARADRFTTTDKLTLAVTLAAWIYVATL